jgi:spore coat protein JB
MEMLKELQELSFVALEFNLYLDTHPCDRRALAEYNCFTQAYQAAKMRYERMYGPITNFGYAPSQYPWQWIETPWPWQIGSEEDC